MWFPLLVSLVLNMMQRDTGVVSNFATPALEEDATRGMNVAMEETWDGKPIAAEPPYGAMVLVYRVELGSGPFCFLFVLL